MASARVASELRILGSTRGSHEDLAKRAADQAGSHAVHVDGRLRRPAVGGTLRVVELERVGARRKKIASDTRRRRHYNSTSGMPCRRASLRPQSGLLDLLYAVDGPTLYCR